MHPEKKPTFFENVGFLNHRSPQSPDLHLILVGVCDKHFCLSVVVGVPPADKNCALVRDENAAIAVTCIDVVKHFRIDIFPVFLLCEKYLFRIVFIDYAIEV